LKVNGVDSRWIATTADWTILSSNPAMPSGRCLPSAFGMYVRRDGAPPKTFMSVVRPPPLSGARSSEASFAGFLPSIGGSISFWPVAFFQAGAISDTTFGP
jgi:hypothetical protein